MQPGDIRQSVYCSNKKGKTRSKQGKACVAFREVEVEVEVGSCIAFVAFPATAGPSCMDTVSLALATLQPGCQVMLQPVCYLSDVVQFPGPSGYGAALIEFVSASGVHGYYQMHPC